MPQRILAWLRKNAALLVTLGSLLFIYGGPYLAHFRNAWSGGRFNDDQRIFIPAFFRYVEPAAWQNDFLGDYALAIAPFGYRALFWTLSCVIDPERLSVLVLYACVLATAGGAFWAAKRLAGWGGGWLAAALVLSSGVYLERCAGGIPRAFGFPIMAWALAALVYRSPRGLVITTVLGAALYPSVGVISGGLLLLQLFEPRRLRQNDEADDGPAATLPFKRKAQLVMTAVGLSFVLLLPSWWATRDYGRRVLTSDIKDYPEAGPLGTHGAEDRPPYKSYFELLPFEAQRGFEGSGPAWWPWLRRQVDGQSQKKIIFDIMFLISLAGLGLRARREGASRSLLLFVVGVIGTHLFARLAAPYLYAPSRFVTYAMPPWGAVLVPIGLSGWLSPLSERVRTAGTFGVGLVLMLLIGGRGDPGRGIFHYVREPVKELYATMARLPPDAMIAGWPDDPMSHVPLVTRRRAFMTGEMHMAFHTGYLDQVRVRLKAFMKAYFATRPEPILELKKTYGVTHILVDVHQLGPKPPGYMPPIGNWVKAEARAARGKRYELLKQLPHATVVRAGKFALVEIDRMKIDVAAP